MKRFLETPVKQLGVSVKVPDDLICFRPVSEKLGLEHQVCQLHVLRWLGRTLRELSEIIPKDWLCVLDEIKNLLAEPPSEGSRRLFELWKQIPEPRAGLDVPLSPLDQPRYLLIRLSEQWDSSRVFAWKEGVPLTNNGTQQAIAGMKMRSRTVRGYKSWRGMRAGLLLSGTGLAF